MAALVGELLVEEVLSYIRVENDKGNRVDVKVMFETIYTDLGLEYLGPKKDLYQKNAAGEHIYAEFILHMSCEKAKKLENFVSKHLKLSVRVAEELNTKSFFEQSKYRDADGNLVAH